MSISIPLVTEYDATTFCGDFNHILLCANTTPRGDNYKINLGSIKNGGATTMAADTIGQRIKEARERLGISQGALAKRCGWSGQTRISNYEKDSREPKISDVKLLSEALGVSRMYLWEGDVASPVVLDDELENDEYAFIPVMSVKAAAGSGYENFQEVNEGTLAFRRDWMIRSGLKEKNLRLIRATGESMEPTIYEGDMLLVDITAIEPHSGCIYALRRPDGSLSVKRLSQGFSGEWTIISDNRNKDKYRDEPIGNISTSSVPIAGRVVWRGGMM